MPNQKCKLCKNKATFHNYNNQEIDCSYCGKYYLIDSFEIDNYNYKNKLNFYKVSSWIREQNDLFNIYPKIDDKKFVELLNMQDKKIKEKFDLMMQNLTKVRKNTNLPRNIALKSWIMNNDELIEIFKKAINNGYIEGKIYHHDSILNFDTITFDGLEYIENLETQNKSSKNIFVAFNFETDLNEVFNTHLNEAITENGFNYTVVNQNNVEHNKSINDEIIVKLKSSRIVIADFTNHRNSVYFEAGFAMGMNIPIIWTCQEGHEDDMSFDTRQFPHIVWKDSADLVKQVIDRIKVIL